MAFLSAAEKRFLQAVSQLAYCNPFLPERIVYEQAALGREFVEGEPVWSLLVKAPDKPRENVWRVSRRLESLCPRLRGELARGADASREELEWYEDGVLHLLYNRYYPRLLEASAGERQGGSVERWRFYREFRTDWQQYFELPGLVLPSGQEAAHTFACFRQIQRAFEQVFQDIIGNSMPAARLRASVWQSIFTHDMRRYRRSLYSRMGDFATLITGPSGTGKELVARAIAHSRYVPFDEGRLTFPGEGEATFFPINISALSPALVESELFGHRRGAFTGATGDRKGWLDTCPPAGSVFLDELGDLDPAIQVKLLRVIETRTFHPVGSTGGRQFRGKLIAATNRDLQADMRAGRFRDDLYYRLCSDQIVTPSLREQVRSSPHVLQDLVVYMARRVAGAEGDALAQEVSDWIARHLDPEYPWPGNYRELEQCVRNVLIRCDYRPSSSGPGDAKDDWMEGLREGRLTAAELLARYCTLVYRQCGSYEETARRLEIDRRTVKSKVLTS